MEHSLALLQQSAQTLPQDFAYLGVALFLLVVARLIKDWLTPFKLGSELTSKDNPALGISVAGYYGAVLIVLLGTFSTAPAQEETVLWHDLLATFGYGLLGVLLLNAARAVVDKLMLRSFSTLKEIIEDQNAGTGAVEAGAYVASGLVIAGALHGTGGGPHTTVAFFGLGQLALILYGWLYQKVCRYDVHAQIEQDNVAAGVALGMNLVAVGIVLMKGVSGSFLGWGHNLTTFAFYFVLGALVLLVLRVAVDLLLFPGASMRKEIVEDRNANVAWIEGAVLAGVAGLVVTIF